MVCVTPVSRQNRPVFSRFQAFIVQDETEGEFGGRGPSGLVQKQRQGGKLRIWNANLPFGPALARLLPA